MIFRVKWRRITLRSSKADYRRALYAYLHPETEKILYIGKADKYTIHQRLTGANKERVWDCLLSHGVEKYGLIAGCVVSDSIRRFTSEMLSDIESLLIHRIKPRYNRQSKKSRVSRPGMVVSCEGDWPDKRSIFRDK